MNEYFTEGKNVFISFESIVRSSYLDMICLIHQHFFSKDNNYCLNKNQERRF